MTAAAYDDPVVIVDANYSFGKLHIPTPKANAYPTNARAGLQRGHAWEQHDSEDQRQESSLPEAANCM
jgi:hypothetical protein